MNRITVRWWMDARWQDKLTGSNVFFRWRGEAGFVELLCFRTQLVYLFASLSAKLQENGWTDCMKFSGKVWSDHGTTWLNLWSIRSSGKWVSGSKVNLLSPDIALWFDCCLLHGSPVLQSSDSYCSVFYWAINDWLIDGNEIAVFGLSLHRNTGARFVVLRTTACLINYG